MKKRFTDCDIWNKEWFQNAPLKFKCAWRFLCDNCSNAGIWDVNIRLMEFQIGERFDAGELLEFFGDRIQDIDGKKWILTGFVRFQYGNLSRDCRPHKPIIDELEANGIEILDGNLNRVSKGYPKGINTLKDKDKEKDQEKDKDQDTEKDTARGRADSIFEVVALAKSERLPESDGEWFFENMEAGGWMRGKAKLKNWKAHFRAWARAGHMPSQKGQPKNALLTGTEKARAML